MNEFKLLHAKAVGSTLEPVIRVVTPRMMWQAYKLSLLL